MDPLIDSPYYFIFISQNTTHYSGFEVASNEIKSDNYDSISALTALFSISLTLLDLFS